MALSNKYAEVATLLIMKIKTSTVGNKQV